MNWVTADLPGIGGRYKFCPEDFFVEEIPLYPCCGAGEHLYLQIEKRSLTTSELLRQISAALEISEREIGYAGLKDARAVTRQWLSLPARCEKSLTRLDRLPLRILDGNRHGNKLRLGHLLGNRFSLRLRDPAPQAKRKADLILNRLQQQGVPNRFGEQRYGLLGNSHRLGQLLLTGHYRQFCHELIGDPRQIENQAWRQAAELFRGGKPAEAAQHLPQKMVDEKRLLSLLARGGTEKKAVLALPKRLLRLYLSALQSWLFDQLLSRRLADLGQLEDGDLALKHANGASFLVDSAAAEQPRADRFEISPTAPLFGSQVKLAERAPGAREKALLLDHGLELHHWKLGDGLTMTGERRALRVPVHAVATRECGNDLQLDFSLPAGSYATSVLHELMKQTPLISPALYDLKSDRQS